MKRLLKLRRSSIVIFIIICFCFILPQCINRHNHENNESVIDDTKFQQYAGSESCAKCHKQIYDSFITTGHNLTSQQANEKNIKGSLEDGKNIYQYSHELFMSIEKTDSGVYEVKHQKGTKSTIGSIDIIIGSGTRGQTYLTWKNNSLFQLPISYMTPLNQWVNSPGAGNNLVIYRPVYVRCLECHATYANRIASGFNGQGEFARKQIIYGVTCEKCHGPGAKHVEFQTEYPNARVAKYIINPHTFIRLQSLNQCRLCHGGKMNPTKPAFSFTAGDTLQNYFHINDSAKGAQMDVHGNQYGLLAESKCFKNTATLTCVTCHDPHDNERGNVELFSQRCMTCHNEEHSTFCKIDPKTIGADNYASIKSNCIDCHMPKEKSNVIIMQVNDSSKTEAASLRTHFIALYPWATKKYLAEKNLKIAQ